MKRIYIERDAASENAILSSISSPDEPGLRLSGLERGWRHNRSNISCIPDGVYALLPWTSPKYGEVYTFCGGTVTPVQEDVPNHAGRWGNLIHPANYWNQLEGCLALGMTRGENDGDLCVWSSKQACGVFRETMGYEPMIAYVSWKPEVAWGSRGG